MYKVVSDFRDLKDGGYIYRAGDTYPRSGVKAEPTAARIKELSTRENKMKKVLIEKVEEPKVEKAEVAEAPKPKRKKKRDVGTNTEGTEELLHS